ncbi:cytochrome c oxidase subunit II [Pseudooceanicola aestuarii]|uniref:cytochrome c oxidase subunit II n=1 Tax=Pseudooceanicola aestuarii TaxID=2697319 RepID=UPI0013D6D863|nr:cytochrome c oxidase subunit II [Pseudooceanicola aestuarii]
MRFLKLLPALLAFLAALPASAQDGLETVGKPISGGMGFQPATTELARDLQWLDGMILVIITAIVIFVCGLLLFVILRYNRRANPTPKTFTHNSPLEIAWTIVPIVILLFIGVFSLPTLFKQQIIPDGDIHIKVTGYQWYWGYEYTDHEFAFDSFLLPKEELAANGFAEDEYLLATDTSVVVPVGKTVVMTVTGADVIHSWTVPSFGVKQDAVPGRLAQLWFKPEKEGIYFGQCSELCGKDHAYMPITVKVVSEEAYAEWLDGAIADYAGTPRSYDIAAR